LERKRNQDTLEQSKRSLHRKIKRVGTRPLEALLQCWLRETSYFLLASYSFFLLYGVLLFLCFGHVYDYDEPSKWKSEMGDVSCGECFRLIRSTISLVSVKIFVFISSFNYVKKQEIFIHKWNKRDHAFVKERCRPVAKKIDTPSSWLLN